MMSTTCYFVRDKGKVRGPFAEDHLHRLVALGLVGLSAELSTDRSSWRALTAHLDCDGQPAEAPLPCSTRAVAGEDYELDLSGLQSTSTATGIDHGSGSDWFESIDLGKMGDD